MTLGLGMSFPPRQRGLEWLGREVSKPAVRRQRLLGERLSPLTRSVYLLIEN